MKPVSNPMVAVADLSNCDQEPIHIPGSIQPHGALLAFTADGMLADPVVVKNSATGGRIGVFYQTASQDNDPRGEVISEWINNWYLEAVSGGN